MLPELLHGYRPLAAIARGRRSIVWRALDPARGRVVALKHDRGCVCGGGRGDAAVAATGPATLRHPHLIDIFDDHPGVVAMELCAGGPSDAYLNRRFGRRSPVARTALACRLAAEGALALGCLHQRRLLHLDVTPRNLLVALEEQPGSATRRPVARLSDLELVRAERGGEIGIIAGTPAFMAPEQHRGGPLDVRTDLFGLGATLLALASGEVPFGRGSEPEVYRRKLRGRWRAAAAPAGDGALQGFRRALEGLLAPDPGDRIGTAGEAAGLLRALGEDGDEAPIRAQRLVGRDPILGRIAAALARSSAGRPSVILASGPSGSGRTAVARAAGRYSTALGLEVRFRKHLARPPSRPGLHILDDADRLTSGELSQVVAAALALGLRPESPSSAPCLLLVIATESAAAGRIRTAFAADRSDRIVRIDVAPLVVSEAAEFVAACTDQPGDHARAAAELHRLSGGLPALFGPILAGRGLGSVAASLTAPERELLRQLALSRLPWPRRHWLPDRDTVAVLERRRLVTRTRGGVVAIAAGALGAALRERMSAAERVAMARGLTARLAPRAGTPLALELALESADLRRVDASLPPVLRDLRARQAWDQIVDLVARAATVPGLSPVTAARAMWAAALAHEALGDRVAAEAQALAAVAIADAAAETASTPAAQTAVAALATESLAIAARAADAAGLRPLAALRHAEVLRRASVGGQAALAIDALILLGRPEEALVAARAAGSLAAETRARAALGTARRQAGDLAGARLALRGAVRCGRRAGAPEVEAKLYLEMGNLWRYSGNSRRARRWWERALAVLGPRATVGSRIPVHNNLGIAADDEERYGDALRHYGETLVLCRRAGNVEGTLITLSNMVPVQMVSLEPAAAWCSGREALDLAMRYGLERHEPALHANLADLARMTGQWDEVEAHARAVRAPGNAIGDLIAAFNLAQVQAARGLVFRRFRHEALAATRALHERIAVVEPEGALAIEIEVDMLTFAGEATQASCDRLAELSQRAREAGVRYVARKAVVAEVRMLAARGDGVTARRLALRLVREVGRHALSEITVLALGARAMATGAVADHIACVGAVDRVAHQLGDTYGPSFRRRIDIASLVLAAVEAAIPGDLATAIDLAERLVPCPELCWRADGLIAAAALARGRPGVGIYRAERARQILARSPPLALEARLDPCLAPHLRAIAVGEPES